MANADPLASITRPSDPEFDAAVRAAGMRACAWPDCDEVFDAVGHIFIGDNIQPGWRRSSVVGYIGPAHSGATHLPQMTGTDPDGVPVVSCDCGTWRLENPPTLGAAADAWREHVREVTADAG